MGEVIAEATGTAALLVIQKTNVLVIQHPKKELLNNSECFVINLDRKELCLGTLQDYKQLMLAKLSENGNWESLGGKINLANRDVKAAIAVNALF